MMEKSTNSCWCSLIANWVKKGREKEQDGEKMLIIIIAFKLPLVKIRLMGTYHSVYCLEKCLS